ncbi:hypothetical protein ACVWW6_000420 [Bradyrhizobium sp. USDA 3311]
MQLVRKTGRTSASAFLEALIAAVPYKIHTVLTDNGIQFTFPPRYADGPTARYTTHMFDIRCQENGIEHRLTKIKHPWTNGQVERMNRTIKEATVQRYHYDRHDQLEAHLADFINAYNYARRLKTLKGLTPYEYICKCWTSQPERFKLNPLQQMPGLNTDAIIAAAKEAGVHEMIIKLREGYGTQVGEQGTALSAGQAQRVALARALYGNPFLIVLDEPNSNLDSEGDEALTRAVCAARGRGAVVIVVAHRSIGIEGVDQLLVLKDGRMQTFGPKEAVLGQVLQRVPPPPIKIVSDAGAAKS